MTENSIPFIDLQTQQRTIRKKLEDAIARVLDHGHYILGKEVQELESKLAEYTNVNHVICCANGTDALQLVLMAENIGPGDAVFVPAFTFVGSAEVIPLLGATPVFVDVEPGSFNLDPRSLEKAITTAHNEGLTPKVVIVVDLFGQPANYPEINSIAHKFDLVVLSDAAQGFGNSLNGLRTGQMSTWTTTSFFPAKPLGCYGDGGAVFTADPERAEIVRSLRFHGKGKFKYDNVRIGINSRLDTIQAAILIEKLEIFDRELVLREQIASRYIEGLKDAVETPFIIEGAKSSWAQFTLKVKDRDNIQNKLKEQGIPTAVYYPITMNKQEGYKNFPVVSGGVPVSENLANQVISLPMHPYLNKESQDIIINAVKSAV